jgi:NAD(P)-dependent dehydrogenase (short-subunit alcohol dehydrogenase family)
MLSEKTILIAGGGHGIGKAVAIELGTYGATVIVNDLGTSPEGIGRDESPSDETVAGIRERGGTAMAHVGDVTDLKYTAKLVDDVIEEHGRLDAVVNFAGIVRNRPITEMSWEDWEAVLTVHLGGHFSLLKSVATRWQRRAEADNFECERSFLGVSSRSALGGREQINYSSAKAGVLGFCRAAAQELHAHDVRVNALLPAGRSRQNSHFPSHDETPSPPDPAKVAPLVGFLCSDAATGITGCTVRASGERIGIVSDPELERSAVNPEGWTPESIAEHFPEVIGEPLDRAETLRDRIK